MKSDPIRVLVVDDQQIERRGLATLLLSFSDMLLVGVARNGAEALEHCATVHPHVVLMDLLMPDMNGAEATRVIRQRFPKIHVIVLTNWDEYVLVQNALAVGAESYLLKNVGAVELAEAIREASPTQAATLATQPELGADLTARELEVLIQVAHGLTNGQIAANLLISRATVKYHLSSILGKLSANSRTEAAALAVQYNLITLPKEVPQED